MDETKLIVADDESETKISSSFITNTVESHDEEISLSSNDNSVDELDASNDSTAVEISLPGSFNDSLSLHGLQIHSKLSPPKILEVRLLQSQLVETRREITTLRHEKQSDLELLKEENNGFVLLTEEDYKGKKQVPTGQQNVLDRLQIKIYEILSAKMEALQRDQDRARQTCEEAKLEKEIASKANTIFKQKQNGFEQSIQVANALQKKMEEKVNGLQDMLIESQNKTRTFEDALAKINFLGEKEIRLKTLIRNQEGEIKKERDKVKQKDEEVISLQREVQELKTDYSFLMKEKKLLSERVTMSEENFKRSQSDLRDVTLKYEDSMINLSKERTCAQGEAETKRTIELQRCHEESERNLILYQSKVEEAFNREVRLLEETKLDIMVQRDNARAEIEKLKLKIEQVCIEKDQRIAKLQEDLYENRNDLKAQSIENVSIETTYQTQNKLVLELRKEIQKLNEKLDAHRNEFKNLEHEHMYQKNQLHQELEKKEQQLELYYHSQMKDFSTGNLDHNKLNPLHLLDKVTILQGQCRVLKCKVENIEQESKMQEKKTQIAEKKLALAEFALKEGTSKSAMSEQGQSSSIDHLIVQNNALQKDLSRVRDDRDKLGREFTFILEKYHNAIELGEKKYGITTTSCEGKTIKVPIMNSRRSAKPSDIDPLLVHAKHHGGKIQRLR